MHGVHQTDSLNGSYQSADVTFGVFDNVKWRLAVCEGSHHKGLNMVHVGADVPNSSRALKKLIFPESTHDNMKD